MLLQIISGLVFSYLLGSIPTGYIFGRLFKGIDLRKHGSGNMGATNAFRVLGKPIGTAVLVLDILKGTGAVLVSAWLFKTPSSGISRELFICLSAIAAVCGHNWTIFLGFKGGKGIATSLGSLIAFAILVPGFVWVVLLILVLWSAIFLWSGFVSLASVISSAILPLLAIFFRLPMEIIVFVSILAAFSLIRHKSNISRLLQNKENRFNTRSILKKFSK